MNSRSPTPTSPASPRGLVPPDEIRSRFSRAMSEMYRLEVPQYGTLLALVADVNAAALRDDPALAAQLARSGEIDRLEVERHGAIRVGTPEELHTLRRMFAVLGMQPVGYYDLTVAGVPVHSTAFRPVGDAALARNPFRVFTSLLRLELIEDPALRAEAAAILAARQIFTARALALLDRCETAGGLRSDEADEFVVELRETFRWHREATVPAATYRRLHDAHRLLADVVCFKGPHINHLTPRTLDIDQAQDEMPKRGIAAKDVIEGPPPRRHAILLRQTSFKALEEAVVFTGDEGATPGTHTARFGEIEQRGAALTRRGRALYDELLAQARDADTGGASYPERLARAFEAFPDDLPTLRRERLAFFRYSLTDPEHASHGTAVGAVFDLEALIDAGRVRFDPIVYEDFLPVSAAGIFQSNLGGGGTANAAGHASKASLEQALSVPVLDEISLYEAAEIASIEAIRRQLDPSGDAAGR